MTKTKKLANELYNVLIKYDDLFSKYRLEKNKKEIEKLSKENFSFYIKNCMMNDFVERYLSIMIRETKKESIKVIKDGLLDFESCTAIENTLRNCIEIVKPLDEIENTVLFFYNKVPRSICESAIKEKFDNDYSKYWNIYTEIKDLEDKVFLYRTQNLKNEFE